MTRSLERVITNDEADLALLALANEKRRFAIQMGGMTEENQGAFERGIDGEWFTLVDVAPLAHVPHGRPSNAVFRVFRLTDAGLRRLAELRQQIGSTQ